MAESYCSQIAKEAPSFGLINESLRECESKAVMVVCNPHCSEQPIEPKSNSQRQRRGRAGRDTCSLPLLPRLFNMFSHRHGSDSSKICCASTPRIAEDDTMTSLEMAHPTMTLPPRVCTWDSRIVQLPYANSFPNLNKDQHEQLQYVSQNKVKSPSSARLAHLYSPRAVLPLSPPTLGLPLTTITTSTTT